MAYPSGRMQTMVYKKALRAIIEQEILAGQKAPNDWALVKFSQCSKATRKAGQMRRRKRKRPSRL